MPFPEREATELLAQCHRRCCICHRFCGFKMELDHMVSKTEGGPDSIDNAIPVCFECHAEIHAYNDKHPRGRKYRPEELRRHKEQWLEICRGAAAFLASVPPRTDVGPFQALIDELEFNQAITATADEVPQIGAAAPLQVTQFERCITEGILSLIEPDLKVAILDTYALLKRVNVQIEAIGQFARGSDPWANAVNAARDGLNAAAPLVERAKDMITRNVATER